MATTRFDSVFSTPLGQMHAVLDTRGSLVRLEFDGRVRRLRQDVCRDPESCREVRRQMTEYFRGERKSFDLTLAPEGTPFQIAVWKELVAIPFGQRITYGELAARLGRPEAARAVGGANGANPIAIVIPCHRVVGSDGSLTGYGGGVSIKQWLLDHESGARRLWA